MKKLLAAAAALTFLAAVFSGCASVDASYKSKAYEAAVTDVETIHLDVTNRLIKITESEDDAIHLTYYESEKEACRISVTENKTLSMTISEQKEWKDYIGVKAPQEYRTIGLSIPNGMIQNLQISTTNEDVLVSSLEILNVVEITVNHGNIQLNAPKAGGTIRLETKNGDITGTLIGSYDAYSIVSEARKGENSLPAQKEGGKKTLNAFTNNGDIRLQFVKGS